MDNLGTRARSLLSRQVTGTRYFFLDFAPRRARWGVMLGGRERCRPDYLVRRDRFPYHVVEGVMEGHGEIVRDGRRQSVGPGAVYAYGPRTPCEIRTDPAQPLVKFFLCLAGPGCARRLAAAGLGPSALRHVTPFTEVAAIAEDIIREGQHGGFRGREICQHLCEVLLFKIETSAPDTAPAADPARARFLRCKALIDAEAAALIDLAELAARTGIEQTSLCRLFRRFQGTSPYQYLLRRKMTLAAEHLLQHGALVKEAAMEVGFADPFHFSRVFKAVHGVAPSELARLGTGTAPAP